MLKQEEVCSRKTDDSGAFAMKPLRSGVRYRFLLRETTYMLREPVVFSSDSEALEIEAIPALGFDVGVRDAETGHPLDAFEIRLHVGDEDASRGIAGAAGRLSRLIPFPDAPV